MKESVPPSSFLLHPWFMRSDGALGGRLENGLTGGIAEAQEHFLGAIRFILRKQNQSLFESNHSKIVILTGALDTIKESRKVDELAAGVHESEINEVDRVGRCPSRHDMKFLG